ncbi:MAG TPA: bacterioferritin [Candidatus Avirikenella pullistercoris]|mgnify:CR=1 FL=1|nr:bacterioferritin [Candidatus Avirikenella pullistercoris]
MEKRVKSIELLNKAIEEELITLHQYMYFHFVCEDRGYDPLAALFKRISIEEMIHVEELAERILFLKGDVIMNVKIEVKQLHDVKEMLQAALKLEDMSIHDYNEFAKICSENSDSISKRLFEALVEKEERHYDLFDIELDNVKEFGDNYLALQSIEHGKSVAEEAPRKTEL